MRLLLVEDNMQSAGLLVRLFESTGHDVVHKTHGLAGLRAAREENFDAILLDFDLPDIDGSQVGLLLRPAMKHIPIIALTAQDDTVTRNKAKAFGFSAFIAKPWSIAELVETLHRLTNREVENIELLEHKLNTQELNAISSGRRPDEIAR